MEVKEVVDKGVEKMWSWRRRSTRIGRKKKLGVEKGA